MPDTDAAPPRLGDFTATSRILPLCVLAIAIGALSAYVALALLKLIGLFTNVFYFHRLSTDLLRPADSTLGLWMVAVPVVGALLIGLLARFGSDRIRGHGIPEALEAILIRGSKVEPKVAILKPLSAAISIGSGGPFGSEGPIIMTGGAFGSIIAQFFKLTAAERKTLLVAGAAAGMSATFASPIAAVMLAVELLLFEWKPRSFVPVALASATAMFLRRYLLGAGPLFPVPAHVAAISPGALASCVLVGACAGGLSALLTYSVYASEDFFKKLPIHWMWWPAIGGLVIGLGGLVFPRALGVGYDVIESLLNDQMPAKEILLLIVVKWTIWAVALGSGTSGGVLAPLLMMGAALGGLLAPYLPNMGPGFWPLISLGAILGGTMRSPLTGILFTLELTHDLNALLPVLVAVTTAHAFTVLVLRRSILTEKVERRGFHVSREYSIDPLEVLFVKEVMQTDILRFPGTQAADDSLQRADADEKSHNQWSYPVVGDDDVLLGIVTLNMLRFRSRPTSGGPQAPSLLRIMHQDPLFALPDESLRSVVYRMAKSGITRLPVVTPESPRKVLGMIMLTDLLKARAQHLEEEQRREQILPLPFLPADVRTTRRYRADREKAGA
ncbi:MAG TPA: chloride channel protein [Planctomycetota bacterium]|nr:chloride channel protein [Planctomycetota bacterium]